MDRRTALKAGLVSATTLALAPSEAMAIQRSKRNRTDESGGSQFIEAETAQGRIRGIRGTGVAIFRGIPYAGSVSGANRFRAPPPPPTWTGVRDAIHYGAPSVQEADARGRIQSYAAPPVAEDCLYLNVWTPALDGKRRPVMFYSHGGGFLTGSGGSPTREGSNLAREHDVVVVTHNHRLGLLGYLKVDDLLGPEYESNLQLRDIIAALRWVRTNIAAFGGDPDNVFAFGESGGGGKTAMLHALPDAQPLFHKAAIHSSVRIEVNTEDIARATTRTVLKRLGIAPGDARKLLEVPAAELLKAQLTFRERRSFADFGIPAQTPEQLEGFWPWVDGRFVTSHPWSPSAPAVSARKPLLIGTCREEMSQLAIPLHRDGNDERLKAELAKVFAGNADRVYRTYREAFPAADPGHLQMQVMTDLQFWAGSILMTERKASLQAAPVWSFRVAYENPVTYPGSTVPFGSPHASEIPLIFLNHAVAGDVGALDQSATREQAARNMSALWAGFARSGRPEAQGLPGWPAYSPGNRAVMHLSENCKVIEDPLPSLRKMWESLRGTY